MRYPKIIDELYGGKITVVRLVLTIPNPMNTSRIMIKLVHNYLGLNEYNELTFKKEICKIISKITSKMKWSGQVYGKLYSTLYNFRKNAGAGISYF